MSSCVASKENSQFGLPIGTDGKFKGFSRRGVRVDTVYRFMGSIKGINKNPRTQNFWEAVHIPRPEGTRRRNGVARASKRTGVLEEWSPNKICGCRGAQPLLRSRPDSGGMDIRGGLS